MLSGQGKLLVKKYETMRKEHAKATTLVTLLQKCWADELKKKQELNKKFLTVLKDNGQLKFENFDMHQSLKESSRKLEVAESAREVAEAGRQKYKRLSQNLLTIKKQSDEEHSASV